MPEEEGERNIAGLPLGGDEGDVLTKSSGDDLDTEWAPGSGGGGGGAEGALQAADFLFTETDVAGVYTASLDVEEGTVVWAAQAWLLASWKADTGWFGVVDSLGTYFDPTSHTIGGDQGAYDPTAPNSATVYATTNTDGDYGAAQPLVGAGERGPGRYYAATDTITITIDTSDSTPETLDTTGRFLVRIVYTTPATATDAEFAPAP